MRLGREAARREGAPVGALREVENVSLYQPLETPSQGFFLQSKKRLRLLPSDKLSVNEFSRLYGDGSLGVS